VIVGLGVVIVLKPWVARIQFYLVLAGLAFLMLALGRRWGEPEKLTTQALTAQEGEICSH